MSTPPSSWSEIEQRLWHAVGRGEPLNVAAVSSTGGTRPLDGTANGLVSADVLAYLMLQPPSPTSGVVSKLHLVGARVTGRLLLRHAIVELPVALVNCYFDEPIELDNATLRAADFDGCQMPSFEANGLRVSGDLTLSRLVSSKVSLFRAEINGNLWLNEAQISTTQDGFALHGPQMRIGGGLYAESIHVAGCLNLWGAEAFTIEVTNAQLSFDAGPAFRGDGISLRRDLNCSNVTVSDGGISLFGATIGGQFWLNDAKVSHSSGWAVNAPLVTVGGGLYGRGLAANGGVNLFAATISESIELPHSTLISYRHRSLRAPGSHIGGSLILDDAVNVAGTVDLHRSDIKGALTISGATFSDADDTTIDLRRATIGIFDLTGISVPPAALDLRGATIDTIDDEPDSWPQRIAFRMLTYRALNPLLPAGRRLVWLGRDDDNYHPQPYEHLAAHYRQQGHDNDERAVLLARHRLRRRNLRPLAQVWGYFEDATTGYGYRPVRALGWLLVLTTVVATVFSITPPRSLQPDSGSPFHPVAYALDLILPILDLGQQSSFIPVGATQWLAWASSLAGWLLATTVIAGITRALTRS